MIPYNIIKELLFAGVKFKYVSYDHKSAVKELIQLGTVVQSQHIPYVDINTDTRYFSSRLIPQEIKDNHLVWRVGKLREIRFLPNGEIRSVRIGNKYHKTFYISDFGYIVKPIIFPSNDRYDLIRQGLAVAAE